MSFDGENLIRKTLRLAQKGRGRVSPNPMVGAVITHKDHIIAEGYHHRFGAEHAEVDAIRTATQDVDGGSLYVNLEPCSHQGKQPPCVEEIVASGIKEVIVGAKDPNPRVNGKGIAYLRQRGIAVKVGLLESECRKLNASFYKYFEHGLPYITLKVAQTIDGMISGADGNSKWISSPESRKFTHRLRAENDAILAGIGTVLSDNPQLDVRLVKGRNPRRIILDSRLRIPLDASLLNDQSVHQTIIATTRPALQSKVEQIQAKGAQVFRLPSNETGGIELKALCLKLAEIGVTSMLIEGGSRIFSAFLRAKLVDKLAIFIAPKILGDGLRAMPGLNIAGLHESLDLSDFKTRRIGPDILLTGNVMESN